jgi:nitrogen fixation protein FixH
MSLRESSNEGRCRPKKVTGRTVFICLVAFFAVVAGANAILIHVAVSTFGGVETDSAYRAGLAFAREMATARAQDALHWNVSAKVLREDGATVIEVVARDPSDRPISNFAATAELVHPTDRRADLAVPLIGTAPGVFHGRTTDVIGQWDLVIELSRDGTRLFRSKNRVMLH